MLNAIVMLASLWTGFLNPPDSAKPWCYYWWINGHVDEKTITADLESMRELGFGGILLFDSRGYWDDSDDFVVNPKAELEWGSPRWYDLVEHTLRECARLKLEFTMNASASGGEFNGFADGVKYVTDVSDAKAVAAHLDRVVGPLLKRCPDLVGKTFTHIYSISYEGKLRKGATWSAVRESFYGTMRSWAHRHGLKVYSESGGPWPSDVAAALGDADQLSILACNDVPQGEFWPQGQNGFSPFARHANVGARYFTRGPVLAARQAGLPVVSAEAFTHMQRHWSVDPAFLKPLADQAFADGINRIVWHTFTASPERFGVPGAEYFAGSHVNRNVTWHREAGPFVRYLGRCSYLLRQGEYVDDGEFAEVSTNYYGWGRHRRDPKAQFTTIHRRTKDGDLFFVAGEGDGAVDFNASGPAEIWNAVEGTRKPVRGKAIGAGRTRIDLSLPVGGSCFVVFGRTDGRLPEPSEGPKVKTAVNGPWQVSFSYHPGIASSPPEPVVLNELVDFTSREDLMHFAGKATYRGTFEFNGRSSGAVRLSLGKVPSGLAHVWLNGVDCGTVWCEPWACDVGQAVRKGKNELRIDYFNNWYNRLVGDCLLPEGKRVTRSTIHYWATPRTGDHMRVSGRKPTLCSGYSATDPLQPSGVLGPIEVVAAGAGDDADVMSAAYREIWNAAEQARIDADIEANRKADAAFDLRLPDGTRVEVEQVDHEFKFGAHIFNFNQLGDPAKNDAYRRSYGPGGLFNSATVAFYWNAYEPTPGNCRDAGGYEDSEEFWCRTAEPMAHPYWRRPAPGPVVDFCKQRGIRIHGHILVWGLAMPMWLYNQDCPEEEKARFVRWGVRRFDPLLPRDPSERDWAVRTVWKRTWQNVFGELSEEEIAARAPRWTAKLRQRFRDRVRHVAERYGDVVDSWDVVNESSGDWEHYGKSRTGLPVWKSSYGLMPGDYPLHALLDAKEFFPARAKLNVNDYNVGPAFLAQLQDLQREGAKIDVVGCQMHIFDTNDCRRLAEGATDVNWVGTPAAIRARLDTMARAGKRLHVSEVTICAPGTDAKSRAIQAVLARNIYRAWFSHPAVEAITWWNTVDGGAVKGEPEVSGLFTRDLKRKPAYEALDALINREWRTRLTATVKDGKLSFRGFRGTYRLSWDCPHCGGRHERRVVVGAPADPFDADQQPVCGPVVRSFRVDGKPVKLGPGEEWIDLAKLYPGEVVKGRRGTRWATVEFEIEAKESGSLTFLRHNDVIGMLSVNGKPAWGSTGVELPADAEFGLELYGPSVGWAPTRIRVEKGVNRIRYRTRAGSGGAWTCGFRVP